MSLPKNPPPTRRLFSPWRKLFVIWLREKRGGEEQTTLGHYELLRVMTTQGNVVIYRKNKSDVLHFQNPCSQKLYNEFFEDEVWHFEREKKPDLPEQVTIVTPDGEPRVVTKRMAAMVERDGWDCAYCAQPLSLTTITYEHFLSKSAGGPDNLANLGPSCLKCNNKVGNWPVSRKMRYAVELAIKRTNDAFIKGAAAAAKELAGNQRRKRK